MTKGNAKRAAALLLLLGAMLTVSMGCTRMTGSQAQSVRDAVMERDPAAVRAALAAHGDREEQNEAGATPLMTACASNQYVIAELLIDHGADIWAVDRYGITIGHLIGIGAPLPGTPEGDARARVIAKLQARGFPLPPPPQREVLAMIADRRWPPAGGR